MAFYSIETGRFSLSRFSVELTVRRAANAAIWPLAVVAARHRKWRVERQMIDLPQHIRKDIGYRTSGPYAGPSEF